MQFVYAANYLVQLFCLFAFCLFFEDVAVECLLLFL